jgi:hypothetical protein
VCDGYFQQDQYYTPHRLELIREMESSDEYWIMDGMKINVRDFVCNPCNIPYTPQDAVISIRLDDFLYVGWPSSNIVPPTFYVDILKQMTFKNLYIICDTLKHEWEKDYIKLFDIYKPILIQGSLMGDAVAIRDAPRLIHSNSTLCWVMSFLCKTPKERHIPVTYFYEAQKLTAIEPCDRVFDVTPMKHVDIHTLNKCSTWLSQIYLHTKRVYSQSTQDGALEYIFQNIGEGSKYCVEFGFNSSSLTVGTGANVANLVKNHGWTQLLLDGEYENKDINLHKEFITSENIGDIFEKYHVPKEPDYVSIDLDSCDLWVFKGMLEKYKPRVVSVEYNSHYPLEYAITLNNIPSLRWSGTRAYGASLKALNLVATEKDYVLVYVVRCLDAFFIRKDLLAGQILPPLEAFREVTGIPCHVYGRDSMFDEMIDYEVWSSTGDINKAKEAATPINNQVALP